MKNLLQRSSIAGYLIVGVMALVFTSHAVLFADPKDPKPKKENYKVVVEPDEATVEVGESVAFSAHLVGKDGNQVDGDISWSTTGKNVGFVDSDGIFTGTAGGQCQGVATPGKKSGRAKVRNIARERITLKG